MTGYKIEKFRVQINGEVGEIDLPISLDGIVKKCMMAAEYGGVSLFSTLHMDQSAASSRYTYLRITDAPSLSEVRLGGEVIYTVTEHLYRHAIDMKPYIHRLPAELELVFAKDGMISDGGVGVFGSVEFIRFNTAAINGITVTEALTPDGVTLTVKLSSLGSMDSVRAVATLVSGSGQMYYGGLSGLVGSIHVKDPLYWWPKGLGIQNLYKLTVNLYGEMEIEDTLEVKVGLRLFSLPQGANSSLLTVNGDAYLPMGAVYVPETRRDILTAKRRENAFLASAARAGFNTFVIPDGAPMPTEEFFDLCDAYGISVVIEANADGDSSDKLIRRIAGVYYHPSFGMVDVFGDERAVKAFMDKLSIVAPDLPVLVCNGRPEYPSNPSLPIEKTLYTWLAQDERNLFSEKVEANGDELVRRMLISASEYYPYAGTLTDFAYLSGINAAREVKDFVSATRASRGTLGRAIYSRLGECEFGVSDSSLDSHARWKALQYEAARAFAPVVLSARNNGEGYVSFYISNERRQAFVGTVDYRIIDRDNNVIYSESAPCEVEKSTAKLLFARDLGKFIKGHERECFIEYILRDPTGIHTKDVLMFTAAKRFRYADPEIKAEIVGSDRRFSITVSAARFASAVEISFSETEVILSDNYFDITSAAPIKISLTVTGGIETAQHLSRTMKIRSVYDLVRPTEE